jgi:hypothetical protein
MAFPVKKSQLIGSCFKYMHTSFFAYARKEKHISDLILSYSGDIDSSEKPNAIYDRELLQREYMVKHCFDALKSRQLTIIDMSSSKKRRKLDTVLKKWEQTAQSEEAQYRQIYKSSPPKSLARKEAKEKQKFFLFLTVYIPLIFNKTIQAPFVSAVIDDRGIIQAFSFSKWDKKNKNARNIELIMTAPHNFIAGHPKQVKGAGSALIEDAIGKSMQRQALSLTSAHSAKTMQKTAVTLEAASSEQFYLNLFFEIDKARKGHAGRKYLILKGDNLFRFLEEYGGRARSTIKSTL